jgi:hypothetical protein
VHDKSNYYVDIKQKGGKVVLDQEDMKNLKKESLNMEKK